MSYRTVSIKLAWPTAVKRQAIDQAMVRYTRAFQALLAACRPQCQQMAGQGGTYSAALCGREQLALFIPRGKPNGLHRGCCAATWAAGKPGIPPPTRCAGRRMGI